MNERRFPSPRSRKNVDYIKRQWGAKSVAARRWMKVKELKL